MADDPIDPMQKAFDEIFANLPEVGPVDAVAMAQKDCVEKFEAQGFERKEALYLVAAMFSGNPGLAPG